MMQREISGPAINETFDPWKSSDPVHEMADAGKQR
jgi:hypothetical protein